MLCAYCQQPGIIVRGHCANCRAKYLQQPMIAQAFDHVTAEKSCSSYGNYAVRYSPSSIRFFWDIEQAEQWADAYNRTAANI